MTPHGLGRIHSPDERDRNYPMRAVVDEHLKGARTRTKRVWTPSARVWLDQGQTPQCVAYSLSHLYFDGPVTHRTPTIPKPADLYALAQALDGDPTPHDGTSVRAGAQALQNLGLLTAYHWATSVQDIIGALLYAGPVEIGSDWRESMFTVPATGVLEVSGAVAGGHAYVLDAIDTTLGLVRIKNSWSRSWGPLRGYAWLRLTDLEQLLANNGEACLVTETP